MWGMRRNALRVSQVHTLTSRKTSFQLHNLAFCLNRHPWHWNVLLSIILCPTWVRFICWHCRHHVVYEISLFHSRPLHNKVEHFSAERILVNKIKWLKVWTAASYRNATAKQRAGIWSNKGGAETTATLFCDVDLFFDWRLCAGVLINHCKYDRLDW